MTYDRTTTGYYRFSMKNVNSYLPYFWGGCPIDALPTDAEGMAGLLGCTGLGLFATVALLGRSGLSSPFFISVLDSLPLPLLRPRFIVCPDLGSHHCSLRGSQIATMLLVSVVRPSRPWRLITVISEPSSSSTLRSFPTKGCDTPTCSAMLVSLMPV